MSYPFPLSLLTREQRSERLKSNRKKGKLLEGAVYYATKALTDSCLGQTGKEEAAPNGDVFTQYVTIENGEETLWEVRWRSPTKRDDPGNPDVTIWRNGKPIVEIEAKNIRPTRRDNGQKVLWTYEQWKKHAARRFKDKPRGKHRILITSMWNYPPSQRKKIKKLFSDLGIKVHKVRHTETEGEIQETKQEVTKILRQYVTRETLKQA